MKDTFRLSGILNANRLLAPSFFHCSLEIFCWAYCQMRSWAIKIIVCILWKMFVESLSFSFEEKFTKNSFENNKEEKIEAKRIVLKKCGEKCIVYSLFLFWLDWKWDAFGELDWMQYVCNSFEQQPECQSVRRYLWLSLMARKTYQSITPCEFSVVQTKWSIEFETVLIFRVFWVQPWIIFYKFIANHIMSHPSKHFIVF